MRKVKAEFIKQLDGNIVLTIGDFEVSKFDENRMWLCKPNGEGTGIWNHEVEDMFARYFRDNM